MARTRRPVIRPRRSAFAAAFLSFVFPGLGHAYLRRWGRALMWGLLPVIALAALIGLAIGPARSEVVIGLIQPDMLIVILLVLAVDLLYRMASLVDAWFQARDRSVGSPMTRAFSSVGALAIVLVLVVSHVALAQPVLFVYDAFRSYEAAGGDASELPSVEDLGPAFAHLAEPPGPGDDVGPRSDRSTDAADDVLAGEPWKGTERLDILLIGADGGRRGSSTYLTDTMIVVSVDPGTGRVAFISLPRDTAGVPLPAGWDARRVYGATFGPKINTLYTTARLQPDLFPGGAAQRGYRALMGALSELYGLEIRYYVAVDLRGFRGAVNALGGIAVDIRTPLKDSAYPSDDGRGKLNLYEKPGIRTMNGQQALAFARSRKSTSDFDRAARQQLLVAALRDQLDLDALLRPGVIDQLFKELRTHVKTNIPPRMLPQLVTLARDVDLKKRASLVLSSGKGYSTVCNGCQADGQYKLIPNVQKIRRAVQNVFQRAG